MKLSKETYAYNKRRTNWRTAKARLLEPEEVAWRLYRSAEQKAKRRGLLFDLRYGDVLRQVAKGYCPRTGIKFDNRAKPATGPDLPFRASLDRVDNTIGYFPENIEVVVKIYNQAKLVWNTEDVIRMARGLLEVHNAGGQGGGADAV